jgi:predicted ArsR family transcriptional regulator
MPEPSPTAAFGDPVRPLPDDPRDRTLSPAGDAAVAVDEEAHAGRPGIVGSTIRREILVRLRHEGPTSPDRLAADLGASRTGVLQQLRALEEAGLVRHETVRHGVGRPRHIYDVTDRAQDLFPSNYDGLASGLLAAIRAVGGPQLVDRVFEARREAAAEDIRRRMNERLDPGATLLERVRELAVIQDEQGYLCSAAFEADGVLRLREDNCAIHQVATGTEAPCRAELDLFREVLGADVVRESHIARGDRCCSYRIVEPLEAEAGARAGRIPG